MIRAATHPKGGGGNQEKQQRLPARDGTAQKTILLHDSCNLKMEVVRVLQTDFTTRHTFTAVIHSKFYEKKTSFAMNILAEHRLAVRSTPCPFGFSFTSSAINFRYVQA
ncbi:hypothetical protein HUU40_17725 [candidate division KSB1 bacterium]|nr:hypothetical protein [candidate division KSB1 bacterium]